MNETPKEPTVAQALEMWRDAERQSIRATAQREAADVAADAARMAEEAAHATATAADAAQTAATEAARAARATAEAARKVLVATQAQSDTSKFVEDKAIAAEIDAREAHHAARDRVMERSKESSLGG